MALPTEKDVHATIFLRKLPKRVQKQVVWDLCAPFGRLDDVLIFHGRGTALVEFQHLDGDQILHVPLTCAGKVVEAQRAQAAHISRAEDSQKITKQVQFVIDGIVRQIEHAERMENKQLRFERKEMHLKLLQQLVDQEHRTGHRYPPDVCRKCARSQPWGLAHKRRAELWKELREEPKEAHKPESEHKGKKRAREADEHEEAHSDPEELKIREEPEQADTFQGDCSTHPIVPLISLTPRQRWYNLDDSFASVCESRAIKKEINEKLARLSMSLANKRCLILDGASANTARALLTRPDRSPMDIIIPNNITETYCSLKASAIANPFYGSVLNYLHHTHYLFCGPSSTASVTSTSPASQTTTAVATQTTYRDTTSISLFPNPSTSSSSCASSSSASSAFLSSASSSFPSSSSKAFGLIYLDYCCRLEAGGSLAEKSPISDICTLFELGFIDSQGCVLAVCLCKPALNLKEQVSISASAIDVPSARERLALCHLRALIAHLAAQHGLVATWIEDLSYGGSLGNYVLILRVQASQ